MSFQQPDGYRGTTKYTDEKGRKIKGGPVETVQPRRGATSERREDVEGKSKFTVEPATSGKSCVVVPEGAKFSASELWRFAQMNGAYDVQKDEEAGDLYIIVRFSDSIQQESLNFDQLNARLTRDDASLDE